MTAVDQKAKRALDFFASLAGLLAVSPVFAAIAILIKLDTRGPVFFRQERAGPNGTTFRIFKFRTMIVGAYRSGARLTVKRDPRITSVGHFLRWSKLDELPQLLNVLLGDMSFVEQGEPAAVAYMAFFGLLFGLRRWWWQADAYRPKRLKVTSALFTALLGYVLTTIIYFPHAWGTVWAVVIACVVQLAAAWTPPGDRLPVAMPQRPAA